jgi:phosphatidylethanolamine-binding protein (PEBP) family uncharacterized protein
MKNFLIPVILSLFIPLVANGEEFSINFEWGDLKLCTTGNPNMVKNPTFTLTNVPDGTKWIHFKLVDHNARSYNHGGGWVEYIGQSKVEPGEFKYKSPCPPNGKHKYEWTASAKAKKSGWGAVFEKAQSSKMYP